MSRPRGVYDDKMRAPSTRLLRVHHLLPIALAAAAAGCTPSAPMEVNETTWYLYREWDNKDPAVMRAGLLSLEKLLEAKKLGPDGAGDDRLMHLQSIRRMDITVDPWPSDRDPSKTLGYAVTRQSRWPVDDFARVQADPDQLAVEPSATMYTRTYVDPTDPSCLVGAACSTIRTSNELTRENATLKLTYVLRKDFRWFDLGDGRRALVGRAWEPMSFRGQTGAILQSFTIDIFLPRPGDVTWRYQSTFSEQQLSVATTDDIQIAVVTGAVDEAFKKADTVIGKRYHGMM